MSLFHFHDSAEHGHSHGTFAEILDPRVKLVGAIAIAVWIGLLPPTGESALLLLAISLVILGGLGGIAPMTLLVRASAALPFVLVPGLLRLLTGTFDAHTVLWMAARGYVAAMVTALLVGITPFPVLLSAAFAVGVPDLLVQTTALVYRYLTVLRDRASAMMSSARARGYGPASPQRVAIGGAMIGSLLLASLSRSERVHRSMLARGYTGRFPVTRSLRMRPVDWIVGVSLAAALIGSLVALR